MRTARARPPVIIIGMHRSGTTAVVAALRRLGLFMGARLDKNLEAIFFRGLNDWLLHQSGAAWDHPAPVRSLLGDRAVRSLATDYLSRVVRAPRAASFLGWGDYLRYRSLDRCPLPWGWKDPRNTFTLPLWLDLFPGARVVHVIRHGVDVAASLRARRAGDLARRRQKYERNRWLYAVWPKRTGFTDSIRCATLQGGLDLWDEYVSEGRRHVATLGDRAHQVRYEALVEQPSPTIADLASFCDVPHSEASLARAASVVRRDRAAAYLDDLDLAAFASGEAGRLRAHGY